MYQSSLTIQIFSTHNLISTTIQAIAPLHDFTHIIETVPKFDQYRLSRGDIILLDVPLPFTLQEIRTHCKKDALLILCTAQPQLIEPLAYHSINEIWLTPCTAEYIIFQFQKVLEHLKLKKDYRLAQNYLHTAINSIPDLVWFKDLRGAHLEVNQAFCQAVGKTKADIQGRGHFYIWDMKAEEYEKGEYICLESESFVMQARKTCLFDEKVKSKNGMRQFRTYKSPLFDDAGNIIGTVGIAHDVTALENMNTELEIILRSLPFAIIIKDKNGAIINANDKFEEYFQLSKRTMIGKQYDDWKSSVIHILTKYEDDKYPEFKLFIDGEFRILNVQEEEIVDVFHNLVGYICIYSDITLERTFEEQIIRNANTDFLTGLYNRRFFYAYISEHRKSQQTSLLSLDLDYFKQVNDTYGHQAGDEALVVAAQVIQELFPDDLTARIGGDEFIVALLGDYTLAALKRQAEVLLEKMRLAFAASEKLKRMSLSIGIATTTNPALKIDELIKQSDLALYEAKQQGKSQYCMYHSEKRS